MNKKLEALRIHNNFIIVYALSTVIMLGFGGKLSKELLLTNLSLVLFVALSEVVQFFCSNFLLFLLGHVLSIWGCAFLCRVISPTNAQAYFCVILMIIISFMAMYARVKEKLFYYPTIFEGAFFILLFIALKIFHQSEGFLFIFILEVIWAVMTILFYNYRRINGALFSYKDRAKVPYEDITKTNRQILAFSVTLTLILSLIASFLDYGKEILNAIGHVAFSFLRWIFSHFSFKETVGEYEPSENISPGNMDGLFPEIKEDNSIMKYIWNYLFYLVAIIVTIGIIYLLIKAIKAFYKEFNGKKSLLKNRIGRDKVEYLRPILKSEKSLEKSSKDSSKLFERFSKRGRIKAIYKKYIKNGFGIKDINKSLTPYELEKTAYDLVSNKTRIYEKARYSSLEITAKDLEEMGK